MFYTINDFRHKAFHDVYNVYEVFKHYFGESFVDLQDLPDDDTIDESFADAEIPMREDGSGYEIDDMAFNDVTRSYAGIHPFILVYWPIVKVTNENNKSILIYDLYAKITLDAKGRIPVEYGGFTLNRSTYTLEQWNCNYLHSHVSNIPKNYPETFQSPCLGTGPIKDTIHSLQSTFCDGFDEIKWMLFCEELSRYVTVESIAGVPYHHLEDVNFNSSLGGYGKFNHPNAQYVLSVFKEMFTMTGLHRFVEYYLKNGHLAISYKEGCFRVGMSYHDFMIDISNAFINWFNRHYIEKSLVDTMFRRHIINHAVIANNKFFTPNNYRNLNDIRVEDYDGKKVCTFKGKDVTLKIKYSTEFTPQESIVLNHDLSMFILDNILKIINCRYINEYTRQHWQGTDSSNSTTALPAPTHQRVYYL